MLSQVDDFRAWDRRLGRGASIECGVGLRLRRSKEIEQGSAVAILNRGEHLFVTIPGILETEHHGVADEQCVLGLPRLWPDAQDVVFEGSCAQRGQTGIDARRICINQRFLLWWKQHQGLPRKGTKAVDPRFAIDRNRLLAEDLGEFTGGPAP